MAAQSEMSDSWHERRPTRLPGYDYSQPGAYFVTICVKDRLCLFGSVVDGTMVPNDAGRMVTTTWSEMPDHYGDVTLDQFVVMPNHVHGVILLNIHGGRPGGRPRGAAPTLTDLMDRFKTLTTRRYIEGVRRDGWPPFPGQLWQRSYYDHVVRGDESLIEIREYIATNPIKWQLDPEHPQQPI